METAKQIIGHKIYTLKSLMAEFVEKGKTISEQTIRNHLRHGEFGAYRYLDNERFLLKFNAIDEYLNRPLQKKKSKAEKPLHKIIVPKYNNEEARNLATEKIEDEIQNNAEWTKIDGAIESEMQQRLDFYIQLNLQETTVKEIGDEELSEMSNDYLEIPQNLFNYVATRYQTIAQRDYFLNRYWQYYNFNKNNEGFDLKNPAIEMILRNVIDDEIKINHLRWLSNIDPLNFAYKDALTDAIKRWQDMVSGITYLPKRGTKIETKEMETDKDKDKELFTARKMQQSQIK